MGKVLSSVKIRSRNTTTLEMLSRKGFNIRNAMLLKRNCWRREAQKKMLLIFKNVGKCKNCISILPISTYLSHHRIMVSLAFQALVSSSQRATLNKSLATKIAWEMSCPGLQPDIERGVWKG